MTSPFWEALNALGITTRQMVLDVYGSVAQARKALGLAIERSKTPLGERMRTRAPLPGERVG